MGGWKDTNEIVFIDETREMALDDDLLEDAVLARRVEIDEGRSKVGRYEKDKGLKDVAQRPRGSRGVLVDDHLQGASKELSGLVSIECVDQCVCCLQEDLQAALRIAVLELGRPDGDGLTHNVCSLPLQKVGQRDPLSRRRLPHRVSARHPSSKRRGSGCACVEDGRQSGGKRKRWRWRMNGRRPRVGVSCVLCWRVCDVTAFFFFLPHKSHLLLVGPSLHLVGRVVLWTT